MTLVVDSLRVVELLPEQDVSCGLSISNNFVLTIQKGHDLILEKNLSCDKTKVDS